MNTSNSGCGAGSESDSGTRHPRENLNKKEGSQKMIEQAYADYDHAVELARSVLEREDGRAALSAACESIRERLAVRDLSGAAAVARELYTLARRPEDGDAAATATALLWLYILLELVSECCGF